jgi:hypothetical protein
MDFLKALTNTAHLERRDSERSEESPQFFHVLQQRGFFERHFEAV